MFKKAGAIVALALLITACSPSYNWREVDVADGHAPAFGELSHVLELAGLVLVWLLATRRGWPGSARSQVTPAAR